MERYIQPAGEVTGGRERRRRRQEVSESSAQQAGYRAAGRAEQREGEERGKSPGEDCEPDRGSDSWNVREGSIGEGKDLGARYPGPGRAEDPRPKTDSAREEREDYLVA
ncbi:hypothetical protein NHX12_023762 [Muraenolepis orangiensis]|uniref:Uncharacterized protein n=1 Tax=Muraenolepis orangiensis TaxID=630683 RepID=A0A9Q0IT32_9TELE|nr:hypothetical protein NHX12_023762 [Muraenolepis orangiensis]